MEITEKYISNIHRLLDRVLESQSETIDRAVAAVADTLAQGGMVYAFGTGHSHMLAEELFYRAGGLVKVYPILDEPLMLHRNASRSSQVERLSGYAASLLDNGISPTQKDTIFIFSNSGRNAVPVEMALEMNLRGVTTVCITNLAQSSQAESRHPSGYGFAAKATVVGMKINQRHGTGSYPCPPQGWQRSSRLTARYKPFRGPCFCSASTAYWLQVGVKRHEGGVSGEMQRW